METLKHMIYDAIVVGSGISGGWAAKELSEKGLKTLLLERGRNVEHVKDYPTALKHPWEFENRLTITDNDRITNPIQSQVYSEANKHFFVNDQDHPYIQNSAFNWIRGYQMGGRSLTWGRQVYRMSDLDFNANMVDGNGNDWPIRYADIKPWYDYVERFVGVSGNKDGIDHLPDGEFLPPMEMNCIEQHFKRAIEKKLSDRKVIHGRVANLTRGYKSRGPCQYRNLCSRGCPFGGYFSSNSATLPAAMLTGNLTIQPHAIVYQVIYDEKKGVAKGVRVIDEITHQTTEYYARIIFLNASTIATASILLQSANSVFPNGLGNGSGQIGHNLMDHHKSCGAYGTHRGYESYYYEGRRPTGIYIPRFRNVKGQQAELNFTRGYGIQADGERSEWQDMQKSVEGFGVSYKEQITKPGPWTLWMGAWGECLPNYNNKISLSKQHKDKWGLPQVEIDFQFGKNELEMRKDAIENAKLMLEISGFDHIQTFDYSPAGGTTVHEMGTARMGNNPKTSVLNKFNQMHEVKNAFITDGSCMPSGGTQNPSLTYMALTARACDYAVSQMKKLNI